MRFLVIAVLILVFGSFKSDSKLPNNSSHGIDETEKNKELVKKVYTEMVNKRNYGLIDSLYATNIFDHSAFEGQEQGREGFKKAVTEFLGMFSTLEISTHDIIAEGDMVATRETWKVTLASNNKLLTGETMHIFRIKNGLITDEWSKGWEWLGPVTLGQ